MKKSPKIPALSPARMVGKTQNEQNAIADFLLNVEVAAVRTLNKFRMFKRAERNQYIQGSIDYWSNTLKTIRWLSHLNATQGTIDDGPQDSNS